jgi:hypothetical protein
MRLDLVAVATLFAGANAAAQHPAVSFSVDVTPQIRSDRQDDTRFRLYDDQGQLSRVRMNLLFDNGYQIRYFQKLSRIDNDPDDSGTEAFYIEDPGKWSVGKQTASFGTGRMLREPVIGATLRLFLPLGDIPIEISVFDNGGRRQKGVSGRLGDNPGLSFFFGEHFGIAATSLTQLRYPEESPGSGRGYRTALGADYTLASGGWTAVVELLTLRDPNQPSDAEKDIGNLLLSYQFPYGPLVAGELTLTGDAPKAAVRISAEIPVEKNLFVVPSLRLRGAEGWRPALGLRLRL